MHSSERHRESIDSEGRRLELSFGTPDDGDGLVVRDPIERHRFRFATPSPVSPEPADSSRFWFPADAAVSLRTDRIRLPLVVAVIVRDDRGNMLAETEHFADETFPSGSYSLELCAPIKIYLRVEGEVTVVSDAARTELRFGEETTVFVGARSRHKRPAATITTTSEPRDMMAGVSAFGSALKTTTPERSYPSLRGHPPLLELGNELDIPPGVEPNRTGVTIELPADYRHVYVAAPLAYYLGAEVVEGPVPRIVTDDGFEHRLDTTRGFEREVERALKQCFFLDCITRTEGFYEVDLHERRAVESHVDLDFADLYGRPLPDQLEAYLDVPWSTVADHVPGWKLTTHVAPTADNVELLPFATNDLAVVRTPRGSAAAESNVQASTAGEFFRNSFTRGGADADAGRSYVQPESTESLEQAWVGEGTPVGASKATVQAYQNRLSRTQAEGQIGITVVCNDQRMAAERDVVDDVYGSRRELPFDVRVEYDLTVAELRTVLEEGTKFLHYIGHIDDEGFDCPDGRLDVDALPSVAVDSFLLNACQSYEQGARLVEAGAIGGIVTLADVVNSGAVRMGCTLARLLNRGFPLQSALGVASDDSAIGDQYLVVGDGGLAIAQAENGTPNVCVIHRAGDGYELEYRTYPTTDRGMGSLVIPHLVDNSRSFLSSGTIATFEISRDELVRFLSLEDIPVKIDGELRWSSTISSDEL